MVQKSVNVPKISNMKKKILIGILGVSITIITAFNLNLSINSTDYDHSTLSIDNLEALAQNNNGENKDGYSTIDCVDMTITDPDGRITTSEMAICQGTGTKECECP